MSLREALIVTALGMGVVFAGLVLCIAFIRAFERFAARLPAGRPHGAQASAAAGVTEEGASEPVAPDVLAVIVAVLEVERALYVGRYRTRLTLKR